MMQAAEMFDMARAFVLASLPEGLSARERQRRLCARLYGADMARNWARAAAEGRDPR